jgi:hypothetical protein
MFPAFDDRKTNIYSALFYTRSLSESHSEFTENVFGKEAPMPPAVQKATFNECLAETLAEAGYTEGTLSSIDGFTRHLDTDSGRDYSFNLFCREGNGIDLAAKLEGGDLKALISLRSYPLSGEDLDRVYLFADGSTLTSYLDTRDGASRVSTDNLVLYGGESCVELLLQAIPLWVADALSASDLVSLDLEAIWCEDGEIRCTDPSAPIFDLDEKYVKVDLTSGR